MKVQIMPLGRALVFTAFAALLAAAGAESPGAAGAESDGAVAAEPKLAPRDFKQMSPKDFQNVLFGSLAAALPLVQLDSLAEVLPCSIPLLEYRTGSSKRYPMPHLPPAANNLDAIARKPRAAICRDWNNPR